MSVFRAASRRIRTSNLGAFSPERIPGLECWMDASDSSTILQNGTNVADWRSKAGTLTASQTTASLQPAYTTAAQNGLNVVTFDGTGRRMTFNSGVSSTVWSFLHDATEFAIYWVGSAISPNSHTYFSNTRAVTAANDSNGISVMHDFGTLYGNPTIRAIVRSTTGNIATVNTNLNSNTVGCMELIGDLNNATAGNRLRLRLNNGTQASSTAGTGTIATAAPGGPFTLGANGQGTLYGLNGRLCELIIYKRSIASSESTAVRNYLLGKWGI